MKNSKRVELNSWNILITGGSRGIGSELVKYLSKQGNNVITTSRDQNAVEQLIRIPHIIAHQLDLTSSDSIAEFVKWFNEQGIKLDILINNAGMSIMGSVEFISYEDRLKLFQTNVLGPIELTRKLLPNLIERKGKVVFISSDEGLITLPYSIDYGASKHAIDAYTEGLEFELRKLEINVISINPGVVKTSLIMK